MFKKYVLENNEEISKEAIYLAGPTYRSDTQLSTNWPTDSWRDDALAILEGRGFEGVVYIPEFRDRIKPNLWTYSRGIDWEMNSMAKSSVILFWIPRKLYDLPAFTTNIEFGEWMESGKIVVGAPDSAVKNEYLKARCSRLNIEWYTTLDECVTAAMQKSKPLVEGKTWFTADTHFGHERTLELSKRPFSSIEEMDWEIISRWNTVVGDDDSVYHLGDFGDPEIIEHLKGKNINVLPGNYDDPVVISRLQQNKRIQIFKCNHSIYIKGQYFQLIHEPVKATTSQNYFYLFGHIHKLQLVKVNGLNVGVDCHNFYPLSSGDVLFYRNAIIAHYDSNVFLGTLGGE